MRKSKIPEDRLLPYETICAATKADPEALNTVLRHFDGYILRLWQRESSMMSLVSPIAALTRNSKAS